MRKLDSTSPHKSFFSTTKKPIFQKFVTEVLFTDIHYINVQKCSEGTCSENKILSNFSVGYFITKSIEIL